MFFALIIIFDKFIFNFLCSENTWTFKTNSRLKFARLTLLYYLFLLLFLNLILFFGVPLFLLFIKLFLSSFSVFCRLSFGNIRLECTFFYFLFHILLFLDIPVFHFIIVVFDNLICPSMKWNVTFFGFYDIFRFFANFWLFLSNLLNTFFLFFFSF